MFYSYGLHKLILGISCNRELDTEKFEWKFHCGDVRIILNWWKSWKIKRNLSNDGVLLGIWLSALFFFKASQRKSSIRCKA